MVRVSSCRGIQWINGSLGGIGRYPEGHVGREVRVSENVPEVWSGRHKLLMNAQIRHRSAQVALDPLVPLSPIAEPDSDDLLVESECAGYSADVRRAGLGLPQEVMLQRFFSQSADSGATLAPPVRNACKHKQESSSNDRAECNLLKACWLLQLELVLFKFLFWGDI